jgi:hypothetical protein
MILGSGRRVLTKFLLEILYNNGKTEKSDAYEMEFDPAGRSLPCSAAGIWQTQIDTICGYAAGACGEL